MNQNDFSEKLEFKQDIDIALKSFFACIVSFFDEKDKVLNCLYID